MWFEYFLWLWRWQRSIHSIGVAVWARTMKTRRVETLKSFNLLLFKRQWNFLSTLEVCCFHADILPQTALCCLRIDAGHRIREVRHQYSSILHGSMIFIIPWKCYIFAYKLMFNNGIKMMFINELKLVKKMIGNGFVRWFGLLNSFPIHPKFLSKMVLVLYGIRICHHFLLCSNHISWIYRESWTESESRKVACFKRISRILLLVVIYNSDYYYYSLRV